MVKEMKFCESSKSTSGTLRLRTVDKKHKHKASHKMNSNNTTTTAATLDSFYCRPRRILRRLLSVFSCMNDYLIYVSFHHYFWDNRGSLLRL